MAPEKQSVEGLPQCIALQRTIFGSAGERLLRLTNVTRWTVRDSNMSKLKPFICEVNSIDRTRNSATLLIRDSALLMDLNPGDIVVIREPGNEDITFKASPPVPLDAEFVVSVKERVTGNEYHAVVPIRTMPDMGTMEAHLMERDIFSAVRATIRGFLVRYGWVHECGGDACKTPHSEWCPKYGGGQ